MAFLISIEVDFFRHLSLTSIVSSPSVSSLSPSTGPSTSRTTARIDSSNKISSVATTVLLKFANYSRVSSSEISSTPRDFIFLLNSMNGTSTSFFCVGLVFRSNAKHPLIITSSHRTVSITSNIFTFGIDMLTSILLMICWIIKERYLAFIDRITPLPGL